MRWCDEPSTEKNGQQYCAVSHVPHYKYRAVFDFSIYSIYNWFRLNLFNFIHLVKSASRTDSRTSVSIFLSFFAVCDWLNTRENGISVSIETNSDFGFVCNSSVLFMNTWWSFWNDLDCTNSTSSRPPDAHHNESRPKHRLEHETSKQNKKVENQRTSASSPHFRIRQNACGNIPRRVRKMLLPMIFFIYLIKVIFL